MGNFRKELKARGNCQTPPFFIRLGSIGRNITIIGTGIVALTISLTTAGIAVPAMVPLVAGILAALGETVKQVSGLPVEHAGELKRKLEQK